MKFKEYQKAAESTAIYNKQHNLIYPTLGLASEAGEFAGKVKKLLRDDNGIMSVEVRQNLIKEAGDCLWYLAAIARDLDTDLETIAKTNIDKLKDRNKRGVLSGSGDKR